MKIKMYGDPLNISGYSRAMSDHIKAFVSAGIDVKVQRTRVMADELIDSWWREHADEIIQPCTNHDMTMSYGIADTMYFPEENKHNIGYSYWELTKINPKWVESMNRMSSIWSACPSALEAFKNSGVDKPMHVLPWPLGKFWLEECQPVSPHPWLKDQFVFFSMGEFTERKNFRDLIQAYCAEFQDEAMLDTGPKPGGTALVMKSYSGLHESKATASVGQTMAAFRDQLHLPVKPQLILVSRIMTDEELRSLMESIDCFVYPTRGEGMGGPAIQCMARGKPLIAPDHTAISTYHTSPWRVGWSMEPAHSMGYLDAYTGMNAEWARLDVGSMRRCMREAYELWKSDRQAFKKIGLTGRNFVCSNLSYESVGNCARQHFSHALSSS